MKGSINTYLNIAEHLFASYRYGGPDRFIEDLQKRITFIIDKHGQDERETNRRISSLVGMTLSHFLENDANRVLEHQISICEKALSYKNSEQKTSYLIEEMSYFLTAFETGSKRLSESVMSFIKTCRDSELKDMTIESLAKRFKYSPDHLSRKIIMEQGIRLSKIILGERLNRTFEKMAKLECQEDIKVVAKDFGFENARYFRSLFKKKYGELPKKFIKRRQKK